MAKHKQYDEWLKTLSQWLDDVSEHEIPTLVDKMMQAEDAFKDMTKEQIENYKHFLSRDLAHLKANQEHYHALNMEETSIGLAWYELKSMLWSHLSRIEDKVQLEWHALNEDFKHHGKYRATEWIAIGTLICVDCGERRDILSPSEILPCPHCGGVYFRREALSP